MGCDENIRHDRFPKQGNLGEPVLVCFHYDTAHQIRGVIVRDDREAPGETLIKLNDPPNQWPRIVRASECQYTFEKWK